MASAVFVAFEAEYTLDELAEPYDSDAVRQAVQDALGFAGVVVTAIIEADGLVT